MKIVILTDNKTLTEVLKNEIEQMGLCSTYSASEADENDIFIVDRIKIKTSGIPTKNILYIADTYEDDSEVKAKHKLRRPFSFSEFNRIILEMVYNISPNENVIFSRNPIEITIETGGIIFNGRSIDLTKNELLIFSELWKEKGKAVSREHLENISGANKDGNMVTVYINRLREKLSAVTDKRVIKTIRGGGYIIEK